MKLAVIFPSRGMAFSQTCEELLDNLEGYDYDIFFSHGLKIPDCFNTPIERALKGKYSHFWLVEEDMILPKHTLKRLLAAKVPAIMCDYPMDDEGKPAILRDPDNNVIYGGTGCLLVTRAFLKQYKQPIFRTDKVWDIKIGEMVELTEREAPKNMYGLHDVNFSLDAYRRGNPIKVASFTCGQRKLVGLGAQATNIGQHNIALWTKLTPNKMKKQKVNQAYIDGEWVTVSANSKLAKKDQYVVFR